MMLTVDKIRQLVVVFLLMLLAFYMQELLTSNVLQKSFPEWPYLLTLYFSVSYRYFFGVISAFLVGIIQDVFVGVPTIGLGAIIYVLASYFLISTRLRFKHMSIFLQSLSVGVLVTVKILIVMIYEAIFYSPPTHFWVLLSIPMSMLVWPLFHMFFAYFFEKYAA